MELITFCIIVAVVIAVLGLGYLITYLKNKGYVDEDAIEASQQVLMIGSYVLSSFEFNTETQDKIKLAVDITNTVFKYANAYAKDGYKKQVAFDAVIHILDTLNVQVDENMKVAIDFSIEKALDALK